VSVSDFDLAGLLDTIPPAFNTPEIRVDTTDAAKFTIVSEIQNHYKKIYPVNDIDGARITFPHGWGLVRASNTQPSLVIRFEADSREHLEAIQKEVEAVLAEIRKQVGPTP
jgi:phosphomannomutase / phosphoglucomutase